jgi:2-methylcitrate dehydratase PrpD
MAEVAEAATEQLAEFVAGTSVDAFPADLVAAAVRPVVDSIGVMFAGQTADAGATILKYGPRVVSSGPGASRVVGSSLVVPAETAALMNGTLGHSLDFDDEMSGVGHPSNLVLATILAMPGGSTLTGNRLLEAYVTGHEVAAKFGKAIGRPHNKKGWHTTVTAGTFGCVAAAGKLAGLDAGQLRVAFGIAASMAAGLQRNFGTMTKPLHSGLAARNGVLAVELAQLGWTAAKDVLDRPKGFLDVYGVGATEPAALDSLGSPYSLVDPGPTLKKYPCCYASHRAIDAVFEIQAKHHFPAGEIDEVICTAPTGGTAALLYSRPETGLQGKFSMQYTLAAALLDGHIRLDSFTDDAVRRAPARAMIERISVSEDPRCRPEDPQNLRGSTGSGGFMEVVIRSRGTDGLAVVPYPTGSPRKALSWTEMEEKFMDCLRAGGRDSAAGAAVFRQLRDLPEIPDVHALLGELG